MGKLKETILHLLVIISILIAFLCVVLYPVPSYSQGNWKQYVNENFNDPLSLKMRETRDVITYLDSAFRYEQDVLIGYYEVDLLVLDYKYDRRTFAEHGYSLVERNKSVPSLLYMSCESKSMFKVRIYRPNLIYIEYVKNRNAAYTMFCN